MKRWASFRVYSCAIVFAVWAVLWALDIRSRVLVVLFLSLAAASFVISEQERARQRKYLREEFRRGRRS
jgi:hypothetical protein